MHKKLWIFILIATFLGHTLSSAENLGEDRSRRHQIKKEQLSPESWFKKINTYAHPQVGNKGPRGKDTMGLAHLLTLAYVLVGLNQVAEKSKVEVESRIGELNQELLERNPKCEIDLKEEVLEETVDGRRLPFVWVRLNGMRWKKIYLRRHVPAAASPDVTIVGKVSIGESVSAFDGIDYFKQFDREEKVSWESGRPGQPGYVLIEYWPHSMEYRYTKMSMNAERKATRRTLGYDSRSGYTRGASSYPLEREDAEMVQEGLRLAQERLGIAVPTKPLGFSSVGKIVKNVISRWSLWFNRMIWFSEFKPGDYVLLEGRFEDWILLRVASTQIDRRENTDIMEIYHNADDPLFGDRALEIRANDFAVRETVADPSTPVNLYYRGEPGFGRAKKPKRAWRISQAEAQEIAKFRPAQKDPLLPLSIAREAYCISTALQGLQFMRWGLDEIDFETRGKSRLKELMEKQYAQVNAQNYAKALDSLIERFGKKSFSSVVLDLFHQHLGVLHTRYQTPGSPYKPHSDIQKYGRASMQLASQAIRAVHPMPDINMMTFAGNVWNVKTLFGDVDFWRHMKDKYPDLFQSFVDYLLSLPKDFTHTYFGGVVAKTDPVALVKQHFPQAYSVIHEARPDFDSPTPRAIRIVSFGQDDYISYYVHNTLPAVNSLNMLIASLRDDLALVDENPILQKLTAFSSHPQRENIESLIGELIAAQFVQEQDRALLVRLLTDALPPSIFAPVADAFHQQMQISASL